MAENGWGALGAALAGGNTESAFQRGRLNSARLESALSDARLKRDEELARQQLSGRVAMLAPTAEDAGFLEAAFRAGIDPRQFSQYTGDRQEQGFRGDAVTAALGGDWGGANANLMGVANGPQQIGTIEGQNLLANRFLEGGGGITTTEQGRAGIAADAARAAAAYASANNANASAARTRQAMGIDAGEFDMKRSGRWNPGGQAGGGEKPIPVGALKELLSVEDALGGTQLLNNIIQKHAGRIESGTLRVSPASSLLARGRTFIGQATDNDVALNEWNADLTKIVNESLRLNKGVQTEGDAQRAANELMSANDPRTVAAALKRLAGFNRQAAELQARKATMINSNYGRASQVPDLGTVFGGGAPAPSGAARKRFNPATGRVE